MNLTARAQQLWAENLSLEDALPTKMPVYVNSVAYLFGASALSALVMLVLSGLTLAAFGPTWYHSSGAGRFVNSVHFWGVQVFFGTVVAHAMTKFFQAAWRDRRWPTWAAGLLIFAVAVPEGLLGYAAQTNFDAQWIVTQAQDALNAFGVGGFVNVMDTGQVLLLHAALLPVVIVALVLFHLFLIRREGPVKPLGEPRPQAAARVAAGGKGQ